MTLCLPYMPDVPPVVVICPVHPLLLKLHHYLHSTWAITLILQYPWTLCLKLTVRVRYILKGVVYLANEHFTECVITDTGMVWYHDGMFTGRSCVYNSQDVTAIVTENAVIAVYRRDTHTSESENSDMPCEAAAL